MTGHIERGLTLLVAGTFFMEMLDGTILSTAAPTIARAFRVSSDAVGVAITAYLLTVAVLIPLTGWLTDRFGMRRIFLMAIAVFTVASALCAVSVNLPELTVMRVLQGIGGAMMVPVGRLTVLRVTDKSQLVRAVGWLTWPALAAPVIAPFIAGLLTTYATWQWIFVINLPLGVVAFVAALRVVPRAEALGAPPLDSAGFALSFVGIASLVILGSVLSTPASGVAVIVVSAVLGVGASVLAVVRMLRTRHPLLDLTAFRIESFRVAHAGGGVFRLTISAVPFVVPLFFQDALGWSPLEAGSVLLVLFVGNLAIKPFTTSMLRRWGFRNVVVIATVGAVASLVLTALVGRSTPVALIVLLMLFSGITRSIGFTAYNTLAFADVPGDRMTQANTLSSTLQQLAAGLGVAVGAIALRAGLSIAGGQGMVAAYRIAFAILAALTLIAVVEAVVLSRDAGDRIRPVRA
ncbi:MAG TPA: MFS transporter [Galbitalea sp.]|jgi:EmrB/QacA subfamily drug resistance transporter